MASEWRQTTLGEVIRLQRGHDLPDGHRRSGSIPILGSFGITGLHDEARASGPGVTVGRSGGSIGVVAYSAVDYWPLNTCLYVTDFLGNHPRFCYYWLKTFNLASFDSGSAQPSLNRNYIYHLATSIPEIGEQRAIAHVLDSLDRAISLRQETNTILEGISRTIFNSWFVDFDPVRAKAERREPEGMDAVTAALFPNTLSNLETGTLVPHGWQIRTLADALSVAETGGRPKGGVSGIAEGIPSVGAESITGIGEFNFAKTKYIPDSFFAAMRKGHVVDGDVLLYKDGGRPGIFIPHVTMVGEGFPFEQFAINEHVYRLRAQKPISQAYLYFWLTSDLADREMRNRGTGVAIPGLNSTAVKAVPILYATSEVHMAFDSLVEPLSRKILLNALQARTLAELRDMLLPRLISGNLRVPEAEKLVEDIL